MQPPVRVTLQPDQRQRPRLVPFLVDCLGHRGDDNFAEAAFKTSRVHAGCPIGAVTGYLKGARAVGKLRRLTQRNTPKSSNRRPRGYPGELNLGKAGKPEAPRGS